MTRDPLWTTLAHDVGKYIARTARNLGDATLDDELLAMLVKDLYQLGANERASAVVARLAGERREPPLPEVRAALTRLDALEPAVRRGDASAVREAIALALTIEQTLKSALR